MKPLISLFLLVLVLSACASPSQSQQDFGNFLSWSPDDQLLAVAANTGIYVYDTSTLEQVADFPGVAGSTVVFSEEYMSAINGGSLSVWKLEDYSLLFQEKSINPIQFQSLSFSPDGEWLVTGEQKQFRVWSLPDGKMIAKLPAEGFISNLAFTDHDTLIAIGRYTPVIQEWDLQDQKMIRSFKITRDVLFFTLSQDGKVMLVDYGEAGVELWDVEAGKAKHYYHQMQGASGWTTLSGDHQVAAVWGYATDEQHGGIGVWDLAEDQRIWEFSTSFINGASWRYGAFNSDGSVLAASNNQGYIYFYDLKSGEKLGEIFLPYKFTD